MLWKTKTFINLIDVFVIFTISLYQTLLTSMQVMQSCLRNRIAHFHNNPVIDYINLNTEAVKTKLNSSAASDKTPQETLINYRNDG